MIDLIKPKRLKAGDKIATISLSWGGAGTIPNRYEAGKRELSDKFGVTVIEMPHTLKSAEWINRNPKARADDLMQAFDDSSIAGIISCIGGDDSIRTLPYVDIDIIRKNPKVFLGYSDTTITHFMCFKAGLRSFYGPSIMAGFAENCGIFPYMEQSIRRTLFSTDIIGKIDQSDKWTDEMLPWEQDTQSILRKCQSPLGYKILQGNGVVEGNLIGGCIDVFPMLLGQSIWPDKKFFMGAILFLETSEEAPPVDDFKRIIRNLGVQGILESLNGIILGRPGGQLPMDKLTQYDSALFDVVHHEFGLTTLPLMTQMDFGHTDPMFILPYGAKGQIDCNKIEFSILDSSVD